MPTSRVWSTARSQSKNCSPGRPLKCPKSDRVGSGPATQFPFGAAMDVISLDIPAVKLLRPSRFEDSRGFFSEIYSRHALAAVGISAEFVQDNCSFSKATGTVRGLHFQLP